MTKKECCEICANKKQNEYLTRVALRENAILKLKNEIVRIDEIDKSIATIGAKTALAAISGNKKELERIKAAISSLKNERAKILAAAGIENIAYSCQKCHDTGYVDGKFCDCVSLAAREMMIDELSKVAPVAECKFDSFDLNYYQDVVSEGGNPRKRMTEVLKLCREYVINFDPTISKSLLFMGNTGLGKTHLSLAMAHDLIMRGFNVIYGSAYNLFAKMESEHFGEHNDKSYNDAVRCDLLIIDDLGGEFVSPYIQSLVYNIINTRLLSRKPTVINTNLSMADINRIYTPRVASRLLGEYTAKKFLGNDIRQQKSIGK